MIFRIRSESEPNFYHRHKDGMKLLGIFFQGCLHKECEICPSSDVIPMFGGERADTDDILKMFGKDDSIGGIMLSGGEPFLQPVAAYVLAKAAHERGLQVQCRTGYSWDDILQWNDSRSDLLKTIDILISNPKCGTDPVTIDVKKSLKTGSVCLAENA